MGQRISSDSDDTLSSHSSDDTSSSHSSDEILSSHSSDDSDIESDDEMEIHLPGFKFKERKVKTLTEICSKACAEAWLSNEGSQMRDLQRLPPHVINRIVSLIHRKKSKYRKCLNQILQTKCTQLTLPRFLRLPRNTCIVDFQKLEYLDISWCKVPEDLYLQLARNLPSVRTLDLSATNVFNEVLSILGKHATKLETLLLIKTGITDEGIFDLCLFTNDDTQPIEPRTSQIRRLDLSETKVTPMGCYSAMLSLPRLIDLGTEDNFSIFRLFQLKLLERGLDKPFSIEELCGELSVNAIIMAAKLCPNVKRILVQLMSSEKDQLLPLLANFERLTDLILWDPNMRRCSNFILNFNLLLQIRGNNFTCLALSEVSVNVKNIGCLCPNLADFDLCYCYFEDDSSEIVDERKIFQNLRYLLVAVDQYQPMANHLRLLLRNCIKLENLDMDHVEEMTDEMLREVLLHNPMSSLVSARFSGCNNMTSESKQVLLDSVLTIRTLSLV